MGHVHSDHKKRSHLIISIVLNLITTIAEIIGGIASGSLALLSDALHNLSDVFALSVSLVAVELQKFDQTETRTFGFKRAEVLAALLNAAILIVVSVYLFKEAYARFLHPVSINTTVMLIVAVIGLAANAVSVLVLRKDAHDNMNIRTAYVHLFSDTLSSVAVIAGGMCIWFFGVRWIDPLLTVIIGVYVLKEGYEIVMEAVDILMQNAPKGISITDIKNDIERIEGVKDFHHAHIWSVTENRIFLEAHINVSKDVLISETCLLKDKIEQLLKAKYSISHTTLQFEYDSCRNVPLIKPE